MVNVCGAEAVPCVAEKPDSVVGLTDSDGLFGALTVPLTVTLVDAEPLPFVIEPDGEPADAPVSRTVIVAFTDPFDRTTVMVF